MRTTGKSYFFPFVGKLQSGRKRYIEKDGKLGRKVGSVKTAEQMKTEYREVISLLRKGYSILLPLHSETSLNELVNGC